MIGLTEIMRQKNDNRFTELLNRVRTDSLTDEDIDCIQGKSVTKDDNYPADAIHIWAQNKPVHEHNMNMQQQLSTPMFVLRSVEQYPPKFTKQDIDKVLAKGRSATGGLDYNICIKENARLMLTTNVDISDKLINGKIGTAVKISVDPVTN